MALLPIDPRRPTFYLIGAAKSGTTTLAQHMRAHPDLFLTDPKEPNFFADDDQYAQGSATYLNWYYDGAGAFLARGEATPGYFHRGPVVIPRIAAFHSDMPPRFILILRHPITRSLSHYQHRVRTGEEKAGFQDAIACDGSVYLHDSMYAQQLAPWVATFGREAFLIVTLEDLAADPQSVMDQVWQHLNLVSLDSPITHLRANVAAEAKSALLMDAINSRGLHKRILRRLMPSHLRRRLITKLRNANIRPATQTMQIDPATTAHLLSIFAQDITALETLTGQVFADWRKPPETGTAVGEGTVGVH